MYHICYYCHLYQTKNIVRSNLPAFGVASPYSLAIGGRAILIAKPVILESWTEGVSRLEVQFIVHLTLIMVISKIADSLQKCDASGTFMAKRITLPSYNQFNPDQITISSNWLYSPLRSSGFIFQTTLGNKFVKSKSNATYISQWTLMITINQDKWWVFAIWMSDALKNKNNHTSLKFIPTFDFC